MCLYPKLIVNRRYIPNKKNNYNAPQVKDKRTLLIPVGCQKCMECKKQKARQWSIRMQEEVRTNKNGEYVTLTLSNESIRELTTDIQKEWNGIEGYELDNQIATLAVRRFLERWRKKYKVSVKHWLVTELGHKGTENIHIHGIIFKNKYQHDIKGIKEQYLKQQKEDIEKIWKYGYVYIGDYVNEKTVNYITKYITKTDLKHKEYSAKILTSAGIGSNYVNRIDAQLNKYKKGKTREYYTTRQGIKLNLPIYWRNKIYTEEEREALWIEKLDKEERWINGTKISVKDNYEGYYAILKEAQRLNDRLGYGNNIKNWDRIKYEHERRKLQMQKRLTNIEKC